MKFLYEKKYNLEYNIHEVRNKIHRIDELNGKIKSQYSFTLQSTDEKLMLYKISLYSIFNSVLIEVTLSEINEDETQCILKILDVSSKEYLDPASLSSFQSFFSMGLLKLLAEDSNQPIDSYFTSLLNLHDAKEDENTTPIIEGDNINGCIIILIIIIGVITSLIILS
jgi:hypothetical protein